MAYDFPATPTEGQLYTPAGGQTYQYQTGRWVITNTGISALPVGVILAYGGGTAPAGWLVCNGANVSRTTYAGLFAQIGTLWGAGDGSTTFALPDMRGRTIAGHDSGGATGRLAGRVNGVNAATFGASGGLDYEYVTAANMPAHQHLVQQQTDSVGGENVDHAHQTYAYGGYVTADHTHSFQYESRTNVTGSGSTRASDLVNAGTVKATGGISVNHQHLQDSWSGGRNTGHVHAVYTPAHWTDNAGGGGYINTVQPTTIALYMIYAGA